MSAEDRWEQLRDATEWLDGPPQTIEQMVMLWRTGPTDLARVLPMNVEIRPEEYFVGHAHQWPLPEDLSTLNIHDLLRQERKRPLGVERLLAWAVKFPTAQLWYDIVSIGGPFLSGNMFEPIGRLATNPGGRTFTFEKCLRGERLAKGTRVLVELIAE